MAMQEARKTQGRRKVEMKLIPGESSRMVTFSKRRAGVFKKATELSVLCGAQVALIIFSPGGKAYSFGHPNVESVIDRFSSRNLMPDLQDSVQGMRIHSNMLQELKKRCDQVHEELETEKRRGKEIKAALESLPFQITEERINQLDRHKLQQLKLMVEKLGENVHNMINLSSVEPPHLMDAAGPSDPKKASRVSVGMDGYNDYPTLPVQVGLGAVDLSSIDEDGHNASGTPPDDMRSEKDDLATTASDDREASPIPHDWLSL